jgi:hypothetical protein
MRGRRGRSRKQPLDDLKEKRRYWKLKEEALDRTMWRTRFGRGYGPVVRQTAELMNNTLKWSRKRAVGTVTRLRAGRSGDRIPAGTENVSLLQIVQKGSKVHPTSYSIGTGILSWR